MFKSVDDRIIKNYYNIRNLQPVLFWNLAYFDEEWLAQFKYKETNDKKVSGQDDNSRDGVS
jgi:hypothetical protein